MYEATIFYAATTPAVPLVNSGTLDRAARWHQTQMPLVNTGHQSLHIQRLASENLDQQVKRVFTQAYLLYIVHDTLHISLEVVLSDFRQQKRLGHGQGIERN